MKKTLFFVGMALMGLWAQAQQPAPQLGEGYRVMPSVASGAEASPSIGYNASIFAKSQEGDTLMFWDFSSVQGLSMGVIKEGDVIANLPSEQKEADGSVIQDDWHRQNSVWGAWQRQSVTMTLEGLRAAGYAYTYQTLYRWFDNFEEGIMEAMDTAKCSSANGWMLMDMCDMTARPDGKAFNAYFQFDNEIDVTDYEMIDVELYQWYQKYLDHCYIDYSVDGDETWYQYEINVTNVDVNIAGLINGKSRYTMPRNAVTRAQSQNNGRLMLRIRWYSNVPATVDGYGYAWMIDDVRVIAGGKSRINAQLQYYTEGLYQMVPQGMKLPIYWHSRLVNAGSVEQNNIDAYIYNYKEGEDAEIVAKSTGNIANLMVDGSVTAYVDPFGLSVSSDADFGNYCSLTDRNSYRDHQYRDMVKTDRQGDYFVYAQATTEPSDGSDPLTLTYDTVFYHVGGENADMKGYVWGHDNGILEANRAFTYGFVEKNGIDYNTESSLHYKDSGYHVSVRYTMGDVVPVDENGDPWVIRGVEYVPATDTSVRSEGMTSTIIPILWYDYCFLGGTYFWNFPTGVRSYEITDNLYNNDDEGFSVNTLNPDNIYSPARGNGYLEHGEYPTIFVEFPNQPALVANRSYRVGYELAEISNFAVAASAAPTYYTYIHPDSSNRYQRHSFADTNDASLRKFASRTGKTGMVDNPMDVVVFDPSTTDGRRGIYASAYYGYYPMIHLVVGPRVHYGTYNVAVECDYEDGDTGYGEAYDEESVEMCPWGEVGRNYGARGSYQFSFRSGHGDNAAHIDSITFDGTPIWSIAAYKRTNGRGNGGFISLDELDDLEVEFKADTIVYVTILNLQADHKFKVWYKSGRTDVGNDNPTPEPQPETTYYTSKVECVYSDDNAEGEVFSLQSYQSACGRSESIVLGDTVFYDINVTSSDIARLYLDGVLVWSRERGLNDEDNVVWDGVLTAGNGAFVGYGQVSDDDEDYYLVIWYERMSQDHLIQAVFASDGVEPVNPFYTSKVECVYSDDNAEGEVLDLDMWENACGTTESVLSDSVKVYIIDAESTDIAALYVDGVRVWSRDEGLIYVDEDELFDAGDYSYFSRGEVFVWFGDVLHNGINYVAVQYRGFSQSHQLQAVFSSDGEEPVDPTVYYTSEMRCFHNDEVAQGNVLLWIGGSDFEYDVCGRTDTVYYEGQFYYIIDADSLDGLASIYINNTLVWTREEGFNLSVLEPVESDEGYFFNNEVYLWKSYFRYESDDIVRSIIYLSYEGMSRNYVVKAVFEMPEAPEPVVTYDYGISFDCNYAAGETPQTAIVRTSDNGNVCGTVDSLMRDETPAYSIAIDSNSQLQRLVIDGVRVWSRDGGLNSAAGRIERMENELLYITGEAGDISVARAVGDDSSEVLVISFVSLRGDHAVVADFGGGLGSLGITSRVSERVAMTLQPNPATTQVRMTLAGVSGQGDYALLDMSGRVVRSGRFDASQPTDISLSGLAKGAYFVRLTSTGFSSVEKLIVK